MVYAPTTSFRLLAFAFQHWAAEPAMEITDAYKRLYQAMHGGVIVNISPGLSRRIVPSVGPYASTKYALNALTLTARLELAPDNIRVGLMLPGLTATDFHTNAAAMPTGQRERLRTVPADTPEHVAEKIAEAVETEAAEVYADSLRPQQ